MVNAALTHDLKVFNASMTLDDEFGDQVEVGNVVTESGKSRQLAKTEVCFDSILLTCLLG
jgi:hypothetical protein